MAAKILAPLITSILVVFLAASTAIAWRFGFHPALGEPLAGKFYPPLAAWSWWNAWGYQPAYRPQFLQGLALALLPVGAGITAAASQIFKGGGLGHNRRQRDERDDAGLGKPADLFKTERIQTEGYGVVLGRVGNRLLRDQGKGHVLIQGASRSGKGSTFVVPTLVTHGGSMLVLDMKGELADITGRRREQFGPSFVWNPMDPETVRYNPLLELRGLDDPSELRAECEKLSLLLMRVGDSANAEAFWNKAGSELITGLLVHVCEVGTPTFGHMWRLLEDVMAGKRPKSMSAFVRRRIDQYARMEYRLRSSLDKTLTTALSFLSEPLVQQATSDSDLRGSDLQGGVNPVTLFLVVPLDHAERLYPLTRVVLQMLIKPLLYHEVVLADGRKKQHDVLLMLDEFPRLGHMEFIQKDLATCAGYGVRAVLIAQDEEDLLRIYGDHQSLISNCQTKCLIPSYSASTLATARALGGEQLVAYGSRQRQPGKLMLPSWGESESRASVLNEREMLRRGKSEVLIFAQPAPPTWLHKIEYWQQPGLLEHVSPVGLPPAIEARNAEETARKAQLQQKERAA
ncbi:type IV secretory system conjugative DNA transfer family protein [Marinivivus vitaminiproducens]|uniref:type IV secretory system conjugative DNA transfer family protein n=1 Tax=Marinivivus vitaminiproducens TaxID=3035935 RepID=UPI0027A1A2C5|nr:type IV secretory system conjugative DNA transfer family protein [Geminicoccaceae bacterium SCSIO 64248]